MLVLGVDKLWKIASTCFGHTLDGFGPMYLIHWEMHLMLNSAPIHCQLFFIDDRFYHSVSQKDDSP